MPRISAGYTVVIGGHRVRWVISKGTHLHRWSLVVHDNSKGTHQQHVVIRRARYSASTSPAGYKVHPRVPGGWYIGVQNI